MHDAHFTGPGGRGRCHCLYIRAPVRQFFAVRTLEHTTLIIPSLNPGAWAQGAVREEELSPISIAMLIPSLAAIPDGMAGSPRPLRECTCGSQRSFASSAWFGSGLESERRSLCVRNQDTDRGGASNWQGRRSCMRAESIPASRGQRSFFGPWSAIGPEALPVTNLKGLVSRSASSDILSTAYEWWANYVVG
jgi:hypothetical protein